MTKIVDQPQRGDTCQPGATPRVPIESDDQPCKGDTSEPGCPTSSQSAIRPPLFKLNDRQRIVVTNF